MQTKWINLPYKNILFKYNVLQNRYYSKMGQIITYGYFLEENGKNKYV